MNAGEALLHAIVEAPDDDAPRLIYADWLEEHGQPERAEFIRVQIELATGAGNRSQRTQLYLRQRELLRQWERLWAGAFVRFSKSYEFRRGFVESCTGNIHTTRLGGNNNLARLPEELRRTTPLREVRLMHFSIWDQEIPLASLFPALQTLNLQGLDIGDQKLQRLPDELQMRHLRCVDLSCNQLRFHRFDALKIPLLQTAQQIRLGGNYITRVTRQQLLDSEGSRITFDLRRPENHLYRIIPGGDWICGQDLLYRQVLIINTDPMAFRMLAFFFDLDGILLEVQEPRVRTREPLRGAVIDDGRFRGLASELGLVPGPIEVRRFCHTESGVRIDDFREDQLRLLDEPPDARRGSDAEREVYRLLQSSWYPQGQFVFPGLELSALPIN